MILAEERKEPIVCDVLPLGLSLPGTGGRGCKAISPLILLPGGGNTATHGGNTAMEENRSCTSPVCARIQLLNMGNTGAAHCTCKNTVDEQVGKEFLQKNNS